MVLQVRESLERPTPDFLEVATPVDYLELRVQDLCLVQPGKGNGADV